MWKSLPSLLIPSPAVCCCGTGRCTGVGGGILDGAGFTPNAEMVPDTRSSIRNARPLPHHQAHVTSLSEWEPSIGTDRNFERFFGKGLVERSLQWGSKDPGKSLRPTEIRQKPPSKCPRPPLFNETIKFSSIKMQRFELVINLCGIVVCEAICNALSLQSKALSSCLSKAV